MITFLLEELKAIANQPTTDAAKIQGDLSRLISEFKESTLTHEMKMEELNIISSVARQISNAVIITDKNKKIQFVNNSFEKLSGYKMREVIGKSPGSFLQGKDTDPIHVEQFKAKLATKRPFHQEILNYDKRGIPYWQSITITPVLNQKGEVSNFIGIQADITEQKERQEELELILESKNKLLSFVSHDLRSPFVSLISMLDMFIQHQNNFTGEDFTNLMKRILHQSRTTYDLFDNIVTWIKAQAGRIQVSRSRFEVSTLLADCKKSMQYMTSAKNVEIDVTETEDEVYLETDLLILRSVIMNLLSNAVKFSHRSSRISVHYFVRESIFYLEIQDEGIGMPQDVAKQLEKGSLNKSSRGTEGEKGSGIGYSLIHFFVSLLNAELNIESVEGERTCIRISIPMNEVADASPKYQLATPEKF